MSKMNLCECGCGSLAYGRFVRGHHLSAQTITDNALGENVIPEPAQPSGPPLNGPIDRRRWRLAAERSKIPNPSPVWIETQCNNCRTRMFTRDPLSTWEEGGVCEECELALVTEFHDKNHQQFRRHATTYYDPFRPH